MSYSPYSPLSTSVIFTGGALAARGTEHKVRSTREPHNSEVLSIVCSAAVNSIQGLNFSVHGDHRCPPSETQMKLGLLRCFRFSLYIWYRFTSVSGLIIHPSVVTTSGIGDRSGDPGWPCGGLSEVPEVFQKFLIQQLSGSWSSLSLERLPPCR